MEKAKYITNCGFTLIDVLIVVAIAIILLAVVIPGFQSMIKNSRLVTASNSLSGALSYTRTEAIKRGNNVLLGSATGAHVSATAAEAADVGWVTWIDADAGNDWDAGEELRLWPALPSSIAVTVTNNFFIFNSAGEVDNADQFLICDDRSGEEGRQIDLLISGLISSSSYNCP